MTVSELDKLMKRWGFVFSKDGRNHRELRHPGNGKLVNLPRKRAGAASVDLVNEVAAALGVNVGELLAGPPEVVPVNGNGAAPEPEAVVDDTEAEVDAKPEESEEKPSRRSLPVAAPNKRINTRARREVLMALHKAGGKVEDPSGKVLAKLAGLMGRDNASRAFNALLADMEADGQIIRDPVNPSNGRPNPRRTYGIMLCYDGPNVAATLGAVAPPSAPRPEAPTADVVPLRPGVPEPEYEPEAEAAPEAPAPTMPQFDLNAVLGNTAMLERLGAAIGAGIVREVTTRLSMADREAQLRGLVNEIQERLARSTEYSSKLRKENADLRERVQHLESRRPR